MIKHSTNLIIHYTLIVILIIKKNLSHGFIITPALPIQQQKRNILFSTSIIDEESKRTTETEHVDDDPVDETVTESTNGDFILLIDDETDCFHDVEMDYAGLKSEDYEQRWWSSLNDDQKRGTRVVDVLLVFIPVVIPLVGYFTYEPVAAVFDLFVDSLSSKNWVSVDGRQLQTQVLTPAMNGIVVPSVSILFANMISITISTLRQRQLSVLTALN